MAICILDPSNTIFKLKELSFGLLILFSIGSFFQTFNASIFFSSLFLSFLFPLIFVFIGLVVNSNFSQDVALAYIKVFLFVFLINFLLDKKYEYTSIFSKLTLIIVPVTAAILFALLTDNFEIIDGFLGEYYNTVMIASREYGSNTFLMIYYKTVSTLLFGLAFCLTRRSSFRLNILIFLICITLILSATRAIFLSLFFILAFHIYVKLFSSSILKKYSFLFIVGSSIIALAPTILAAFFDKNEGSNSIKLGFVFEYFELWKDKPILFLSGHGIGSAIYTSERGLTYNLETTYFELFRIFGLFGGLFLLFILIYPLIYCFFWRDRLNLSNVDIYYLISYFCYVFFVIPSNPLFLSSTGILVVCITYSLVFRINRNEYVSYIKF
jgi:hypothetical protein